VYFRDLEYLVSIGLQFWFYATPIVYPETVVAEALADRPGLFTIYRLNPMTRFVEVYRDLYYSLRWPSLGDVSYLIVCAVISLVIGWMAFNRLQGRLAEEL
jgi:ABC-2 type transport system permease protein